MGKKAQKIRQKKREQAVQKAQHAAHSDSDDEAGNENSDAEAVKFAPVSCKHLKQVNAAVFPKMERSELKDCVMCTSGGGYNKRPKQSHKLQKKGSSSVVSKPTLDQMWVCLQCGKAVCRANGDAHGMGHFVSYNKHSLVMNVKTQQLYCYGCRDEIVIDQEHPAFHNIRECAKQIQTIMNGPSEVSESEIGAIGVEDEDAKPSKASSKPLETGPGGVLQGVKGLRNGGNTCFYNSIMQNIAQTIPLRERFVFDREGNPAPKTTEGPTTAELRSFMTTMWNSSEKVFSPISLLNAIGKKYTQFRRRHQQDSHELLMCLLDMVSSEEKKILEIIAKAKVEVAKSEISGSSSTNGDNPSPRSEPAEASRTSESQVETTVDETSTHEDSSATESRQDESTAAADNGATSAGEEIIANESDSSAAASSSTPSETPAPAEEPASEASVPDDAEKRVPEESREKDPVPASTESATAPIEDPAATAAKDAPKSSTGLENGTETPPSEKSQESSSSPAPAPPDAPKETQPAPTPNLPKTISPAAWAKMVTVEKILKENGVDAIFGGELESRITCHVCQHRSTVYEPVNALSLSIPMKGMRQFSAGSSSGSSGKGARGASKSSAPEIDYPMKEDAKLSKRERARLFREQQLKEMAMQEESATEPSPTIEVPAQPNTSETTSEANIDARDEANISSSPACSTEAPAPAESHQGDTAAAPDTIRSADVTISHVPEGSEMATEESDLSQVAVHATETAVDSKPPSEQAETDQSPSKDAKLPESSMIQDTNVDAATKEVPSIDDRSSLSSQDADQSVEPTDEPKADSLGESNGKVDLSSVVEEDDAEEEDEPAPAVIEGDRNVRDARTVSSPPKNGTLESCIYDFTSAELLDDSHHWGCYNCTKQAWIASGRDLFDLILQSGPESEQREMLVQREIIDASASRETFLSALKSQLEKSHKRSRVKLIQRRATKQFLVNKQPRVLTLHLKRFMQVSMTKFVKNDADISFPPTLDLNPYSTGADRVEPGQKYVYKLYGISSHSGGIGGGHYVAFTRRRPLGAQALESEDMDDNWYYYSDTQLQKTSLKSVLNQEAYVLFYERILME